MKNRKTRSAMRRMLFTLALVLVVAVASVGGTIAWLTDKTDPVMNTFTVGDINITLDETTGNEYKIIPGTDITKDPKVTVSANSEACWLFVEVTKGDWNDNLTYRMAEGWTALAGHDGVYYRSVSAADAKAGCSFPVIAGDKIIVSDQITKDEITVNPTLTFKAYAVQSENVATPETAWSIAKPAVVPGT